MHRNDSCPFIKQLIQFGPFIFFESEIFPVSFREQTDNRICDAVINLHLIRLRNNL